MMPRDSHPLSPRDVEQLLGGIVRNVRYLSSGGQAMLYEAEFEGRPAAVKIYEDAFLVRAERECVALEQLNSPNIVRLLQWGEINPPGSRRIYTLTEFIEGQTVRDRIDRQLLLDEHAARSLGLNVTAAIRAMWDLAKIVHRDINPRNVMMTPEGVAVVLDLGVARHTQLVTITDRGMTWGTPGYMSPEQARARRNLTFKSDFFSLGIVLYEAVAGRHPFAGCQDFIGRADAPPLVEAAEVTTAFSATVQSLLECDPLDRPRDFEDLSGRLQGG